VRLFLSEHTGDARPDGTIHASHPELADMIAAYRGTVTLTLDEFRRQGLVDLGRRSIELLDRRALEAIALAVRDRMASWLC